LHEFAEGGKLRFQLRHSAFALGLQLLDQFLELRIGNTDLVLDESGSFLQINPDVAHGPLSRICRTMNGEPTLGPPGLSVDNRRPGRKGRTQIPVYDDTPTTARSFDF